MWMSWPTPHPTPHTHNRMSGIWGPPVAHRTPPHEGQVSRTGFLKPSHMAKAPRSQKGPGWETLSPRMEVHSKRRPEAPNNAVCPQVPPEARPLPSPRGPWPAVHAQQAKPARPSETLHSPGRLQSNREAALSRPEAANPEAPTSLRG